jgi:type VI secretion system secreted protein VgrG
LQVTLKGPGGFVDIGPAGVTIQGTLVNINSGGAAGVGSGCSPGSPTAPQDPKEAASDQAGEVSQPPPAGRPPRPVTYSSQATVMQMAAASGAPFCEKCAAAAAAQAAQSSSTPGQ